MSRVAVFVDAGYLFAQGSAALNGAKVPRTQILLNETAAIAELMTVAQAKSANASFLRVYWYDGALGWRGMTPEQAVLANTDYVKIRLGFMNSRRQQKGVDSLIVTDLIELARNGAISDALLLAGDEDVRIGVLIAQSFGVRIHLLGIIPSRGTQSPQLIQEADTTTEWDKPTVAKFLTVKIPVAPPTSAAAPITPVSSTVNPPAAVLTGSAASDYASFDRVVAEIVASLDTAAVAALHTFWTTQNRSSVRTRRPIARQMPNRDRARLVAGREAAHAEEIHCCRESPLATHQLPQSNWPTAVAIHAAVPSPAARGKPTRISPGRMGICGPAAGGNPHRRGKA